MPISQTKLNNGEAIANTMLPAWANRSEDVRSLLQLGWLHMEQGGDYSSLTREMRINARAKKLPIWVIALGIKLIVEIILKLWSARDGEHPA